MELLMQSQMDAISIMMQFSVSLTLIRKRELLVTTVFIVVGRFHESSMPQVPGTNHELLLEEIYASMYEVQQVLHS